MKPTAALFALTALLAAPAARATPLYMSVPSDKDRAELGAKAMELAFDGKWTRAEGLDIKRILASDFTYLDGRDGSLRSLSTFLDDNRESLERYIKSGGRLLVAVTGSNRDQEDRDDKRERDDDGKRDDKGSLRLPYGVSLAWSDDDCEGFSATATKEGLATGVFDDLAASYKDTYFANTSVEGEGFTSLMSSRRGSVYATSRIGDGSLTVTTLDDDREDSFGLRVAQLRLAAGIRPPETAPVPPIVQQVATDIPEPGTLLLIGIGLGGLAWVQRRRS